MKCQILFSRKNKKKYFKMLSAESIHSVVSVEEVKTFIRTASYLNLMPKFLPAGLCITDGHLEYLQHKFSLY